MPRRTWGAQINEAFSYNLASVVYVIDFSGRGSGIESRRICMPVDRVTCLGFPNLYVTIDAIGLVASSFAGGHGVEGRMRLMEGKTRLHIFEKAPKTSAERSRGRDIESILRRTCGHNL